MERKSFTYKGCTIAPYVAPTELLAACNNGVNRYLTKLWRVTFPDKSFVWVGTKGRARDYIDAVLHRHSAPATDKPNLPERVEAVVRAWPDWSPAERRRMDRLVEEVLDHCRNGTGNAFIARWCDEHLAFLRK